MLQKGRLRRRSYLFNYKAHESVPRSLLINMKEYVGVPAGRQHFSKIRKSKDKLTSSKIPFSRRIFTIPLRCISKFPMTPSRGVSIFFSCDPASADSTLIDEASTPAGGLTPGAKETAFLPLSTPAGGLPLTPLAVLAGASEDGEVVRSTGWLGM